MHEIAPHQPAITRAIRGQQRYRDPFRRPTHRQAAHQLQKNRIHSLHSAAPGAIRSRRRYELVRGSGPVRIIAARSVSRRIVGERWCQC
jgi:hypothetical protein